MVLLNMVLSNIFMMISVELIATQAFHSQFMMESTETSLGLRSFLLELISFLIVLKEANVPLPSNLIHIFRAISKYLTIAGIYFWFSSLGVINYKHHLNVKYWSFLTTILEIVIRCQSFDRQYEMYLGGICMISWSLIVGNFMRIICSIYVIKHRHLPIMTRFIIIFISLLFLCLVSLHIVSSYVFFSKTTSLTPSDVDIYIELALIVLNGFMGTVTNYLSLILPRFDWKITMSRWRKSMTYAFDTMITFGITTIALFNSITSTLRFVVGTEFVGVSAMILIYIEISRSSLVENQHLTQLTKQIQFLCNKRKDWSRLKMELKILLTFFFDWAFLISVPWVLVPFHFSSHLPTLPLIWPFHISIALSSALVRFMIFIYMYWYIPVGVCLCVCVFVCMYI